ncbi:MAG TPA: hypothetical protein V6C58_02415 [Allocoleopsis sp.]
MYYRIFRLGMTYVLFYSNYCEYSRQFIKFLEKSGETVHFNKICVDRDPRSGRRHPYVQAYRIKEVPTIIVNRSVYPGEYAFKWLEYRIKNSVSYVDNSNIYDTRQDKINPNSLVNKDSRRKLKFVETKKKKRKTCDMKDANKRITNQSYTDNYLTSRKNYNVESCEEKNIPEGLKSVIAGKENKLKKKQLENLYNKLLQEHEKY